MSAPPAEPTIHLPPFQSPMSKEEINGIADSIKNQLASTMNQIKQQVDQVKPNMQNAQSAMAGMTQHMQDLPHVMHESIHGSPWPKNLHPTTHHLFAHDMQAYGWFLAEQARAAVNDNVWSAVVESGRDSNANFVQEEWFHAVPDPNESNVFYACGHVMDRGQTYLWLCKCLIVAESKQIKVVQSYYTQATRGTGVQLATVTGVDEKSTRVVVLIKTQANVAPVEAKSAASAVNLKSNPSSNKPPSGPSQTEPSTEHVRRALNILRGVKAKSNVADRVASQVAERSAAHLAERSAAQVAEQTKKELVDEKSSTPVVPPLTSWSIVEWNALTNQITTICQRPDTIHPSVTECSPKHLLVHESKYMVLSRVWSGERATLEWLVFNRATNQWDHSWLDSTTRFAIAQVLDASHSMVYILSHTMTHIDIHAYSIGSSSTLTATNSCHIEFPTKYRSDDIWPLSINLFNQVLMIPCVVGSTIRLYSVPTIHSDSLPSAAYQYMTVYEPKIAQLPTYACITPTAQNEVKISICGVLFPEQSRYSEWTQPFVAHVHVRMTTEKGQSAHVAHVHQPGNHVTHVHQPWIEWTEETACTTSQLHHCCNVSGSMIAIGSLDYSVLKKDRDAYAIVWK
jgi:hypothetical protein